MEYRVIRTNDYLAHYGILGMKWGIRRFQKYGEGGYVPKGKHKKIDLRTKKQKENDRINKVLSDVNKDSFNNSEQIKHIQSLGEQATEKANTVADRMGQEYAKLKNEYASAKELSDADKEYFDSQLMRKYKYKDKQEMLKDFEIPDDMLISDLTNMSYSRIQERAQDNCSKEIADFHKSNDEYWNEVNSYMDGMHKKYGDTLTSQIPKSKVPETIEDHIYRDVLDTRWNSYQSRHFSDYWTSDYEDEYTAQIALENLLHKHYTGEWLYE